MKLFKAKFQKRAILVMAPFIFIACEKPNQELGLDQVIGAQAGLEQTTLDVISYTVDVDSLPVTFSYSDQVAIGGYTGNRLVGSYIDDDFGKAEAGIVAQMVMGSVNLDFGANPVVDSVNLFLRYSGSYADTSQPMDLEVLELTEGLSRQRMFHTDFRPQTGEKIGGKSSFAPRPNKPVNIDGTTTSPALRIPMDVDYFQEKFADVGDGNFESFASNESFLEYFKGFLIKAASDDGSILYFNLNNTNSRLVIYYHNDNQQEQRVNLSFSQEGSTRPIHFSIFDQDYENYTTAFDLDDQNEETGEEATYIQTMSGVATVLKVQGIDELKEKDLLINKAFLEIPRKGGTGSELPPPPRLEIRAFTGSGPGATIRDFSAGNIGNITGDGRYRSEEGEQEAYVFDISRYIFDVVNGGEEQDLIILPMIKTTAADRVTLEGGSAADPIELKIYYTKS